MKVAGSFCEFGDYSFLFEDLEVSFDLNKLNVITGNLGSGKSVLVDILIGNVNGNGKVHRPKQISFMTQKSGLMNISIKDNICFGLDFNSEKF